MKRKYQDVFWSLKYDNWIWVDNKVINLLGAILWLSKNEKYKNNCLIHYYIVKNQKILLNILSFKSPLVENSSLLAFIWSLKFFLLNIAPKTIVFDQYFRVFVNWFYLSE